MRPRLHRQVPTTKEIRPQNYFQLCRQPHPAGYDRQVNRHSVPILKLRVHNPYPRAHVHLAELDNVTKRCSSFSSWAAARCATLSPSTRMSSLRSFLKFVEILVEACIPFTSNNSFIVTSNRKISFALTGRTKSPISGRCKVELLGTSSSALHFTCLQNYSTTKSTHKSLMSGALEFPSSRPISASILFTTCKVRTSNLQQQSSICIGILRRCFPNLLFKSSYPT